MKLFKTLGTAIATLTLASTAQASLMIYSIDLLMVDTDYNSRSPHLDAGLPVLDAFTSSLIEGIGLPSENPGNLICDVSLGALEDISARSTCGSDRWDIGSFYVINGFATGSAELEFGMDWGRGGFSGLIQPNLIPVIDRHDSDIWWGNNWNHGDVFGMSITQPGTFSIALLGFENCCDGNNSARWQTAGGEWQSLVVNALPPAAVPAPGTLPLAAVGLLGLVLYRRRSEG